MPVRSDTVTKRTKSSHSLHGHASGKLGFRQDKSIASSKQTEAERVVVMPCFSAHTHTHTHTRARDDDDGLNCTN